jgi:hypothetical protein
MRDQLWQLRLSAGTRSSHPRQFFAQGGHVCGQPVGFAIEFSGTFDSDNSPAALGSEVRLRPRHGGLREANHHPVILLRPNLSLLDITVSCIQLDVCPIACLASIGFSEQHCSRVAWLTLAFRIVRELPLEFCEVP